MGTLSRIINTVTATGSRAARTGAGMGAARGRRATMTGAGRRATMGGRRRSSAGAGGVGTLLRRFLR